MQYNEINNRHEYNKYVEATAKDIIEHTLEEILEGEHGTELTTKNKEIVGDMIFHETSIVSEWIDSDGIIIYYHGHKLITHYSDNMDEVTDDLGEVTVKSWTETRQWFAFHAFRKDVEECISERLITYSTWDNNPFTTPNKQEK